MADKKATLLIELKDSATAALTRVQNAIQELKKSALELGLSFAAITGFIYKSVQAFGESEAAAQRLDNALKNIGTSSAGAGARLSDLATAYSRLTGFTDTSVVSMMSVLATMGFTERNIAAMTPRVLDLARNMGVDASQAALLLGKSIEIGTAAPLKRAGVVLDETSFKNRDLAATLGQIDGKVKGLSETFANSATGKISLFHAAIDRLQSTLGSNFSAALTPIVTKLTNFIESLNASAPHLLSFGTAATLVAAVIAGMAAAFSALSFVLAPVFTMIAGLALPELAAAAGVILLVTNLGNLRTMLIELVSGLGYYAQAVYYTFTMQREKAIEASEAGKKAFGDLKTTADTTATGIADSMKIAYEEIKRVFNGLAAPEVPKPGDPGKAPPLQGFDPEEFQIRLANVKGFHAEAQRLEMEHQAKILDLQGRSAEAALLRDSFNNNAKLKSAQKIFGDLSVLQQSKNKEMAIAGKVAAIGQATVATYLAATEAYAAMAKIDPIILAPAAAAAAIVAGLANVAQISGVQFAEGGMVLPTSGGTLATIGEAGKSEAVIPLDDSRTKERLANVFDSGNGKTEININAGVIVASDYEVEEFARRLDKAFYLLKRRRETSAF